MLKKVSNKKKYLLIGLVVVLLAGGGALAYSQLRGDSTDKKDSINYNPPTKEEKKAADTQKEKNIEREQTEDNPKPISKADITIVDASQYGDTVEIRAYISNILEDGGTCTAKLTNGNQTITRTNQSFKDATTTQCGALNIPRSEFNSTGTWQLTMSYTSNTANGESSIKKVTIE